MNIDYNDYKIVTRFHEGWSGWCFDIFNPFGKKIFESDDEGGEIYQTEDDARDYAEYYIDNHIK